MKNINTPQFWDGEFSKAIQAYQDGNTDHRRFIPYRFQLMLSLMQFRPAKILDIGCGTGEFTRYLYACNPYYQITGIDFSAVAIEHNKAVFNKVNYYQSDCYDTGFKKETFDYVLALDVIEHLSHPVRFLKECKRITKQGGGIIIGTPYAEGKVISPKDHVKEYSPQEMVKLFKKAGIKDLIAGLPMVEVDPSSQKITRHDYYAIKGIK